MKMKILLSFLAAVSSAAASNYMFWNPDSGADAALAENYWEFSGNFNNIWSYPVVYPSNYTGEMKAIDNNYSQVGTYSSAASLPGASDTVAFIRYERALADADGNPVLDGGNQSYEQRWPEGTVFSESYSVGTMLVRGPSSMSLGGAAASSESFLLETGNLMIGYTTLSIKRSSDARQTRFEISVADTLKVECGSSDNVYFGSGGSDGFIDKISAGYLQVMGNVHMFARQMEFSNVTINDPGEMLYLYFDNSIFDSAGAVVRIDGNLKKGSGKSDAAVALDFSNADFSGVSAGDRIVLVSAGMMENFDADDPYRDFTVEGLEAFLPEGLSGVLAWNSGQLQLSIVPEPSAAAAVCAAAAAIALASRRRRGK